jgi:hypothetical protein
VATGGRGPGVKPAAQSARTEGVEISALPSPLDALPLDIVVTDPDLLPSYERDQSQFTLSARPLAVLVPPAAKGRSKRRLPDHVPASRTLRHDR